MATELNKLPSDPSVPQQGQLHPVQQKTQENIKMETIAYCNDLDKKVNVPPIVDSKQMSSMVNNLESMASKGLTQLAEDIPRQTNQITTDSQSVPNAIPGSAPAQKVDYIQNYTTQEQIHNQNLRDQNKQDTLHFILDEIKIPLMIAALYLVYQQPFVKKFILGKFPKMFNDTGNYTTNGLLGMSILFGASYYGINKLIHHYK
jgi:hypothetical protein